MKTNFSHQLLLTDTQISKIRKAFGNGSSSNIKFSKTYLSKIQLEGFDILNLMNPAEVVPKIANESNDLPNKVSLDDVIKIGDISNNFFSKF